MAAWALEKGGTFVEREKRGEKIHLGKKEETSRIIHFMNPFAQEERRRRKPLFSIEQKDGLGKEGERLVCQERGDSSTGKDFMVAASFEK